MDLKQFLTYIHDGAFCAFQQIIEHLSNHDLKSLRLAVDKPLAAAILPYMFKRLFFSIHEEDHEVFQNIVDHPIASKNINQIFWETSLSTLSRVDCEEHRNGIYNQALLFNRGISINDNHNDTDTFNEQCESPNSHDEPPLHEQAADFWTQKQSNWLETVHKNSDLNFLKNSITRLPNLHKLTILSESRLKWTKHNEYTRLWPTPRERAWSKQPFYSFLLSPRPIRSDDGHKGFVRAINSLTALCEEKQIKISALIIESYGLAQLTHATESYVYGNGHGPTSADQSSDIDFDTIINGFTPPMVRPDLIRSQSQSRSGPQSESRLKLKPKSKSKNLTLRVLLELDLPSESLWHKISEREIHLERLAMKCSDTIEEITYYRANLGMLMRFHSSQSQPESDVNPRIVAPAHETDPIFRTLTDCPNLRRIRLYDCWTTDACRFLVWLWRNTKVREIELHAVSSTRVSWYTVLVELRVVGALFDVFEVHSCRSPSEMWGFESRILAPWNGASKDVVAWLKGDSDCFPLWQGPG